MVAQLNTDCGAQLNAEFNAHLCMSFPAYISQSGNTSIICAQSGNKNLLTVSIRKTDFKTLKSVTVFKTQFRKKYVKFLDI